MMHPSMYGVYLHRQRNMVLKRYDDQIHPMWSKYYITVFLHNAIPSFKQFRKSFYVSNKELMEIRSLRIH